MLSFDLFYLCYYVFVWRGTSNLVYEPGDITRQSHAWSTRMLGSLCQSPACVNQEINTSWKSRQKWTFHVYGDNHRIIESNIRECSVCRRPHQCFISFWMSMAWMVRTQNGDKNETESGLLTMNLHKWSPHKTMDRKIKSLDLFSQRGIVFNYINL